MADVCKVGRDDLIASAISHADEWLRNSHEDPEEDVDIKSGDMRGIGEVFQKAPDGAEGKGSAESPEHGLNDDGTLKLVRFFDYVEANYCKRADEGQCRECCEEIDDEAGGMGVVKCPFREDEEKNI
jgi:hypothetical protein